MAGPTVGVAITKSTLWHGEQEKLVNVYYFDGPAFQAGDANFQRLVDAITAAEKLVHGTNVNFVKARVWSAGGTVIQNVTLGLYDLFGTGSFGTAPIFKEAASLVEWECERPNVLGRKVYLRKYIRHGATPSPASIPVQSGEAVLPATMTTPLKQYADTVDVIATEGGVIFYLVSPSGRAIRAANNGVVNNYLISREFRRN